ncbi:hypothetical protein HQK17_28230 [Bacillus cereus]|uniref:hypothetical protein n=1 Tax=Bacillus cereus TaxID=1396 RepID=UPI00156B8209|nr:hypothetical protein [Bacillus cereus]NRQ72011.1 hypothetical protein [Bacillus cereus]
MYLKYAEVGESELSLELVDHVLKQYKTSFEVMFMFKEVRSLYKKRDKQSLKELKNFSRNFDLYEQAVTHLGTRETVGSRILRKSRPTILNLANEYVRIIEGTTREGRKKHLRVM